MRLGKQTLRKLVREELSKVNEMKYSNQTGLKSSILRTSEFTSLLNPKEMKWIRGDNVRIYKDRFGFVFTDGKREMVFNLNKPFSVVKPIGNARSEIKKVYQQNESVLNERPNKKEIEKLASELERQWRMNSGAMSVMIDDIPDKQMDKIRANFRKQAEKQLSESINEGISVFDERHFGKNGIIIMIDDNGKKVSAIFKNKKNANKYNRNKESDLKALLSLAKKTPYPKAIDESINESILSEKKPSKIVWDTKKISAAKRINVRKWYMKTYPSDELGDEINQKLTLWDFYNALSQNRDIYKVIGVGDSVVRERIFEKLSKVLGVAYDTIYNMWESVNEASDEFVIYVEKDNGRKKLLHNNKSSRAAKMFITKNANKILNQSGIRAVGSMRKSDWERDEAQYAENIKKKGMRTVTKKQWDRTHNDYKGMIKGQPYMMWFDKKTQSTVYGPVQIKESVNEGKDDFVARHGKANIILKKGYKHHKDTDLEKLYDKLGSLVKGLKVKDVTLVFESVNEKIEDFETGDLVHIPSINKSAMVLTQYGRKVHVQFPDGKEKTFNSRDLEKIYNESVNEGRAFVAAAKKAKEEGKTEFEFNGKTYPVTIKEVLRKRNRKLR